MTDAVTATNSGPNRVTILLVEDETPVRLLVRRILERQGYRVVEAETGGAALRVWPQCRDRVRILLTDLVMPEGISGSELAQKLQADQPSLKVIFTSGYSREFMGEDFRPGGTLTFLEKPYDPKQLTDAIRACL